MRSFVRRDAKILVALLAAILGCESCSPKPPDTAAAFDAVIADDVASLRRCLDKGVSVDARDSAGETLLQAAVSENRRSIVSELLSRHASVNDQDARGNGALHTAVALRMDLIARRLLESGADPNLKNRAGDTPFTVAYNNRANGDAMALLMLDHGADPNYMKPGDWSVMHFAVADVGGVALLKKLLERGMPADGEDMELMPPPGAMPSSVPDSTWQWEKGPPYILTAAQHGTPEGVELLLRHGANPNHKSSAGTYPIFASLYGGMAMLSVFVEHGANVNAKNQAGQTVLAFLTASMGKSDTRWLFKSGAQQIEYLRAHGARL